MPAISVEDFRRKARSKLPKFLFEYIDGGAYAERTLSRNVADLQDIQLRQRVLRDVDNIDTSADMFGTTYRIPVGLAPVGLAGMNSRRGETAAVKAAEQTNVPFCLSTVSACSLDEVAEAAQKPFWFQLYVIRDRVFMKDLMQRAKAHGCSALVFTVDMPVPGTRYRDYRSGLAGASGFLGDMRRAFQAVRKPQWAWDVGLFGRPHTLGNVAPVLGDKSGLEDFFAWMGANFDPSIAWKDLAFIRQEWDGPLIIKGLLDPADAREAVQLGADGIVVSNHGGRQLDGVLSTARALPAIVDAVRGETRILVDGGIRSGLDVVRMLALGAEGVLVGRAWAYALAAGGQAGVARMIELLEAEMRVAMALTGANRISDITRESLVAHESSVAAAHVHA